MASHDATQAAIVTSGKETEVTWTGGRLRASSDTIAYAAQASGDTINLCAPIPSGALVLAVILNTDTSTSTATLAFSGAAVSAAAAYTTVNTPTLIKFTQQAVLSAPTQLVATIGTAALPASGNLQVTVLYVLD